MNPASGLASDVGSADGATGTRATVGRVKSTGPGREVEIDDVIEIGRLYTSLTVVRLRLREQFRMGASPLDQRLCQRQHLRDCLSQQVRDFRRKRLIETLANDETLLAHVFNVRVRMLSCGTVQCVVCPILVDGIRVDRGKNLYPTQRAVPECRQDGGYPLVLEKVLQVIQSAKDPVVSLRHRASPCSLSGPPMRARSSRPSAGSFPSLSSRRSCQLSGSLHHLPPPVVTGVELPALRQTVGVAHHIPTPIFNDMSLCVVAMGVDSAYGHFRWGITVGITLGIRVGILLERHPLRAAKAPVRGPAGGSAGIPDSLGHKPVNTSGRGGGRLPAASAPWSSPPPCCLISGSITLFLTLLGPFLIIFYTCRRPPAFRQPPAACCPLACENVAAFRWEMCGRVPDWDS
jgi:hypothetical protein